MNDLKRSDADGPRYTVCGVPLDPISDRPIDPRRYGHNRMGEQIADRVTGLIGSFPRCMVCDQPMCAGQQGSHWSFLPGSGHDEM